MKTILSSLRNIFCYFFILLLSVGIVTAQSANDESEWLKKAQQSGFKSSGFIKNVGQVYSLDKRLCPDVLYKASSNGYNLFLTKTGLTIAVAEIEKETVSESASLKSSLPQRKIKAISRLDIDLTGATIKRENIEGQEPADITPIYFYSGLSDDRPEGLKIYKQLLIKEVYPGIDWLLKFDDNNVFKYDFVVLPQADPSIIKMRYIGATSLWLDEKKQNLKINTPLDEITEGEIYAFEKENNREVQSEYVLNNNEVSFLIHEYDKSKMLIIDPPMHLVLVWATYYGGDNS